jgi:hypothetical protein
MSLQTSSENPIFKKPFPDIGNRELFIEFQLGNGTAVTPATEIEYPAKTRFK